MFTLLLLSLVLGQAPCQKGQVVGVDRGRDYTLSICGVGVVALRGVEPPLKVADGFPLIPGPGSLPMPGPVSGEVLGQPDRGPEALAFLSDLITSKKAVSVVLDGFRMGDPGGRQFAYVYLPDKTSINAELIRRGLGYADRQGSHPRRDEFIALEALARRQRVGVWGAVTRPAVTAA